MNVALCDKHPDRRAVATFRISKYPAGTRTGLLGAYPNGSETRLDLCEECVETLSGLCGPGVVPGLADGARIPAPGTG